MKARLFLWVTKYIGCSEWWNVTPKKQGYYVLKNRSKNKLLPMIKNNIYSPNDNEHMDIIQKVIKALSGNNQNVKRIHSCLTFGKFQRKYDMKEFYQVTDMENMFDESLGQEQKLTLQNTLYNKICKDVIEIY